MRERTELVMRNRQRQSLPLAAAVITVALLVTALPAMGASHRAIADSGQRVIVAFDRLPVDAVPRLQAAGITHAALFPAADAASVVGPELAYAKIAAWSDVEAIYEERMYETALYESKVQISVDDVHTGARPLRLPYTGKGVTVAVVDTGIETAHPDLADQVVKNLNFEPSTLLDPITDGGYSQSFAETPEGFDDVGHGTPIAGILAGDGRAAKGADDMRGIAPGASLVNIRFGGSGINLASDPPVQTFYETAILAAYQWIIDHRNDPEFPGGIRVTSNSWGDPTPPSQNDPAMATILKSAVDAGITVVFAAGNEGPGPDTLRFPGSLPWLITVGATCKQTAPPDDQCGAPYEIWDRSSRGDAVDVVAPGVDIWTAHPKMGTLALSGFFFLAADPEYPQAPGHGDPMAETNNRFWYMWFVTGTSAATPHVAGIVALMLEANPDLTHEEIERILQKTAADMGPKGFDHDYGYGQVDALRAVHMAEKGSRRAVQ